MVALLYNEEVINTKNGESVLDSLMRHDHSIPHGCLSGVCQSCLMATEDSAPPESAQQGLSDGQKQLGYFLSCQCVPTETMNIKKIDDEALRTDAVVVEKTFLNSQVIRLRLLANLSYQAGQYVTLWREDGVGRSYSLASLATQEDFLEFHIKLIEAGEFSQWVHQTLKVGDKLGVQGPIGQCFFTATEKQNILLTAIGTGLAPLYGILKQALEQNHLGHIEIVLGAREANSFYLVDELALFAEQYSQLRVHFVAQDNINDGELKDIYQFCKTTFPDLTGWRVFICGADSFVQKMRKQCFLSGAGMSAISSDSFVHS